METTADDIQPDSARGHGTGGRQGGRVRHQGPHVYYGDFLAVREVDLNIAKNEITAFIGPSGCGKSTVLRCFNRMNDLIESARVSRHRSTTTASTCTAPASIAVEVRRRIGMVFQKPNPFPKSIYDNLAFGPTYQRYQEEVRTRRHRRIVAETGGALGRGQGPAQGVGAGHVRRAAAAPVHRPCDRRRARCDPHGRAVLGARPDRHRQDRGADGGDQGGVHDHHRHPQHAAGCTCQRHDGVLLRRGQRDLRHPNRHSRRVRPRPTGSSRIHHDERTERYVTGRFG